MRTKHRDDEDVVRDGQIVKVPMVLMDGRPTYVRDNFGNLSGPGLHRPGFRYAADAAPEADYRAPAHADYVKRLTDSDRQSAYDAMCARLTNSWRDDVRTYKPNPDIYNGPEKDAPDDELDDDDDPRIRAMRERDTRLENAWREPSAATNAIEAQGERGRHGR